MPGGEVESSNGRFQVVRISRFAQVKNGSRNPFAFAVSIAMS
jgi:hypothetical protein